MKKLLLLLFFACFFATTFAQGWRSGEMEVNVQISSKTDALDLYNLKFNGDIYLKNAILYLTPNELELVDAAGFDYEIVITDLNEHYKNFWETRAQYHSYQEIIDLADSLVENFPSICTKTIFGTSLGGRQLTGLKISDNSAIDENEAEVMFDGGIHGNEIGAAENIIRFARDLCVNYGTDPEITDLVDNREIWLYLMVNPDGRANNVRTNNAGVDLNRDWGYMWNGEGSSSGAFSQPESKALRACSYSNQFVVHTTYHSGTEYISCPWSYRGDTPYDMDHILQLAGVYADVSGYSNMEFGQGFNGMYSINGSTKDSNYGIMGSISWSMEISYDKEPPASQIMMFYNYNRPSMLAMIKYSGYGMEGLVTDATNGDPIAAHVFISDFLPTFTDPEVGDYHKYVLAGTYDILVKANGYQDKLVTGITVGSMTSTVTNIELDPLEHHSIYKVISSQIPDNNPSDEGHTWNVYGQPDNLFYSMGKSGWIVLDMLDIIFDGAGPDIMVFEGDASAEGYTVYAGETMDGPWYSMGEGSGTSEFDFAACNISEAQYFKIQDDGDGSASGNDAGFDLDAMQALSSITGPYIIMDGYVVDDASGNNNGILEPGETADFIVTLTNVGTEDALAITGVFTSEDQYLTIITSAPQTFGDIAIGESAETTYTVSADAIAPAGHSATIDFNFEGTNVNTTTKYIMVVFPDYCEASTGTEDEYIANVECGDISNSSAWQGGVANYTDISTELEPGESVPITITNGTPWASDQVTAWVDWDNDFDLGSSTDETFILTNDGSGATFTGDIEAPASVTPGMYRMRIRMTYSSDPTPCGSSSYGEVEDYTVNITGDILEAGFTSDEYEVCQGTEVHYYDNSVGNITSWAWEFPGGTPATSNEENPVVTYNSPGMWGVTLTVGDGTSTNSSVMLEYMVVYDDPATPDTPSGELEMCQDSPNCDYYTNPGACTDWYWEILPATAGTMTQEGPEVEINWDPDFAGDVEISVAGINMCGQSDMSTPIEITILPFPGIAGEIFGADLVCQNTTEGYEVPEMADVNEYEWILDPSNAGSLSINGNECGISFPNNYVGAATLKVRGINDCGEGVWSPDFEITVEVCPGISEKYLSSDIQITPNPNQGKFLIQINNSLDETLSLEVYSATGESVYQSSLRVSTSQTQLSLSIPNIPAGMYYLKVSGDKTLITKKIIIN